MGRKAFCPASQIDINFVENLEDYVGQTHPFLINQVDARDKNIVISRRALLSKELEKSKKQFCTGLQNGDVLNGRITKLMPYGLFVELHPGVDGLVHVSELSWSRVEDAQTFGSMGEPVRVKVIDIETPDASDNLKISLSIKQVTDDPWLSADDHFKVGDKVKGTVTRCAKFGAFAEIADGIEGLIHISEMSYQKRILKPQEIVTPGESVFVLVKDLDLANRRNFVKHTRCRRRPLERGASKILGGPEGRRPYRKEGKIRLFYHPFTRRHRSASKIQNQSVISIHRHRKA
jgi:small subunit ribosomal protein S1